MTLSCGRTALYRSYGQPVESPPVKIRMFAVLATTPALLLSSTPGVAHAYPVKDGDLLYNQLYKMGRLPAAKCGTPAKGATHSSVTRYIKRLVACMDATWAAGFTKASFDIDYEKAWVRVYRTYPERTCGSWGKAVTSAVMYCYRSLEVQLKSDWTKGSGDLPLLAELSKEHGLHVMAHTGLLDAFRALASDGDAEQAEQFRRFALQSDCLGGVFLKSLWTAQRRSAKDWRELLAYTRRSLKPQGPHNAWYGKATSRAYWFDQGFRAGDPRSCNTWKAPSSKVT
jgi:predicted metalloprotease